MRLCARDAPIATPVPEELVLIATVAATAATVAWIDDVSLAETVTAPIGVAATPSVLRVTYASVETPIRLSASEPPPATPSELEPVEATTASAAAIETAVIELA